MEVADLRNRIFQVAAARDRALVLFQTSAGQEGASPPPAPVPGREARGAGREEERGVRWCFG